MVKQQTEEVLPKQEKSEAMEEAVCVTSPEENSRDNPQMTTQIQNISMKEVTDLMAQGESVSFVIVGEGEDALEWIQQTAIVVDNQMVGEDQETQRVVVMETDDIEHSVVVTETSQTESKTEDMSNCTNERGVQNRKRSGSPTGQVTPKILKISTDEVKNQVSACAKSEGVQNNSSANTKPVNSMITESADKNLNITKSVSKSLSSPESHKGKVTQGSTSKEYSPFITIYASSSSASSPSPSGTISSSTNQNCVSGGKVPLHQQITIVTESCAVRDKAAASVHTTQSVVAADSAADCQPIKISSPGANVELTASSDGADSFHEGTKISKESQESAKLNGGGVSTGLVDIGMVYRCAECDYASSNKHYYKQHVDLVHNTARPFKCPFCDYAGKRGHALREHLIVHSAQRPYSCLHCNATFRKKGHLTNHTKLHAASAGSGNSSAVVAMGHPGGPGHLVKVNTLAQSNSGKLVQIPVSFGMAVSSPAISVNAVPAGSVAAVAPPMQKSQPSNAVPLKRGNLWCALCDKEMADADSFQGHLLTVHGTDHLYACDSCEFVTANKGAMMGHLAKHIPTTTTTTTAATTQLPIATAITAPPSISTSVAATPLYTCTQCGFTTPTMSTLVAHAASHSIGAGANSNNTTTMAVKTPLQSQQQQHQLSKVICSECGHVADNTEMMRAHMWTHIGSAAAEPKDKIVLPELLQQKLPGGAVSASTAQATHSTSPAGLKTLPENAAFKCTECSYVSRDASQFVKHMLVHKTQHNQAPKTQAQNTPSNQGTGGMPVTGGHANTASKTGTSYKVKPVTTENTCQNTESSPFVHDASTGRFRCTICGYSCEYQRTIKAHIWKHSGHHQVDYPIFQNGPLSMYEDPVPASQPATPTGQISSGQPATAVTSVHVDVTLSSQLAGSQNSPANLPAPQGNEISHTNPSSNAGSAPLSVKFITVSGSQVLHSSGPLPPGNLKLIPMPPAPATAAKSPLASDNASKHVVLQVQGAELDSSSKPAGGLVLVKEAGASALVKSEAEMPHVKHLDAPGDTDMAALKREPGFKCVGKMELRPRLQGSAVAQAAQEAEDQMDARIGAGRAAVSRTAGRAAVSHTEDPGEHSTSATSTSQISSAKHVLPICTAADVQQKGIAVPVNPRSEVPVQSEPNKSAPDTSAVKVPEPGSDAIQGSEDNLPSSKLDSNTTDQLMSSTSDTDDAEDKLESVVGGGFTKHTEDGDSRNSTAEIALETSIASRVQSRRHSKGSGAEPSVVVETVHTIPTHSTLTGMHSQQSSPRVSRSINSSPVAVDNQEQPSHTDSKTNNREGETSSRTLRSSKARDPREEKGTEAMILLDNDKRVSDTQCTESPSTEAGTNAKDVKLASTQTLQDSESAVTLLSLLKRGPNVNPACPPKPSELIQTGTAVKQESAQDSPNRSPSSSSETDSAAKETFTDLMSEELTSEMESTSSGKTRAGGGGICSTLLAVIEQLRERSRSESDTEDKLTQPPAKKRQGRRRGRQESQEEVLELGDSENIEQLSAEDSVSYRCKLCHYTSPRVPLIRIHMRTHRQKDPFECSLCPMVADSSEMLQEHMIQHCKVRTYACKFCPQSFNHKSTLRAHMRAHNDTDPFLCDLCEFESASPLEYRAHMQKHAGNALLRCPHCPALVASRQDLQVHLAGSCPSASQGRGADRDGEKVDSGSGEETILGESIVCPQCEFTTADMTRMEDHMASHAIVSGVGMGVTGEGPLRCALCDFTAVSSRSLKSHMKRHANDQRYVQQPLEQYKCALCGYVCHHLPSLKSHLWRHASDQNYSYQFTNDVINAAIDYDTRSDPPPLDKTVAMVRKEPDEPELLDRVLSAERRIVEGQMSRAGGSKPVCWVTFRCCQCGFETINKAKLNLHMRTHADIINRTLKVNPGSASEGEGVAIATDLMDSDGMKIKIVYGPV